MTRFKRALLALLAGSVGLGAVVLPMRPAAAAESTRCIDIVVLGQYLTTICL